MDVCHFHESVNVSGLSISCKARVLRTRVMLNLQQEAMWSSMFSQADVLVDDDSHIGVLMICIYRECWLYN